jgi:hypothetical protein
MTIQRNAVCCRRRPKNAAFRSSERHPAKKASMITVLTSIQKAWIAERGDPTLYDLAAQNPVGCLTTDDITDSNIGRK